MKKNHIPRAVASQQKKEQIYATALRLFKQYGFNNVTMKDLVRESGFSEGSIFHFFGSKAGILSSFNDSMFEKAGVYFQLTDENLNDPHQAILSAFFTHGYCFAEIGPELTSMYYNNILLDSKDLKNYSDPAEALSSLYPAFYTFVQEAIKRGTLQLNVSAEDFVTMVYTFCNGLVLVWTRANGDFDLMKLSEPKIRMLVNSLIKE